MGVAGEEQWLLIASNQEPSGPRMICSEYVAHCYRAGGIDLVPNLADRDTTPGDLSRSAALGFLGEVGV